jgi:hypothetical protein
MKTLVIRLAIMILKAMLPELQKKAEETKTSADDLVLQIAVIIVQAWDEGVIKI